MADNKNVPAVTHTGPNPFRALFILVPFIFICSLYANLAFMVTDPDNYRFFPPFKANVNAAIQNGNMQGEYYRMARAVAAGEGFAHPFVQPTGPTAWQPPIYTLFIAGLLWIFDGNLDAVMAVRIFVQVYVLIATGLLVVALVQKNVTGERRGVSAPVLAIFVYLGALVWNFQAFFQRTQDSCFVMLALDVLIVGMCWFQPLGTWKSAAVWGGVGGFCALISPIVGFSWGVLTVVESIKNKTCSRFVLALLCAALAMSPWIVRNYLVFGRIIPVKSNLAFELYQSQCLEENGLLTNFRSHPSGLRNPEGREYLALRETAYLDRKWEQFLEAVAANPFDFADRVATRFLGTTLWYEPFQGQGRPWVTWLKRLTHPLPFLAGVFLLFSAIWQPLTRPQWVVLGLYATYLLPYIVISYYERYGQPLLGIKVLLVVWGVERFWLLLKNERRSKLRC
jgi:hypothetical protein